MKVRFGYVAIALNLEQASTSKTITLTNLRKLPDAASQRARLQRLVKENLENTLRVIRYNQAESIHVYRLTSKLVPFATYPLDFAWEYDREFAGEFELVGKAVRSAQLRVSAHPDHFTVVNSPDETVFQAAVKDLEYHHRVLHAMGLGDDAKLVLHLGGFYGDKEGSIERFKTNFYRLPEPVRRRLVLENDDKIFTVADILQVCEKLNLPMVLDLHHHRCNPGGNLAELLPRVWRSWGEERPKVHVSSPRNSKQFRHHADFIEPSEVWGFLNLARGLEQDFDVMVEAKMKDRAMFQLVSELSRLPEVTQKDPTSISLDKPF